MCPLCITTAAVTTSAALTTAGATSGIGFLALVLAKRRAIARWFRKLLG